MLTERPVTQCRTSRNRTDRNLSITMIQHALAQLSPWMDLIMRLFESLKRKLNHLSAATFVTFAMTGAMTGLPAQQAHATLMLDVTSNAGISVVCGSCTFGYDFTLNSATTIRAMGIYDHQANGLNGAHQVGLWDASQTLLRSTTIDNASVAIAGGPGSISNHQWLFENIPEITLGAGTYFVGMTQPTTGQDLEVQGNVNFNLDGTKGVGRFGGFNGGGLTLAFPGNSSNSNGFFGPNLSTAAVPLPGALGMFLLGMIGLGFVGRRRPTT